MKNYVFILTFFLLNLIYAQKANQFSIKGTIQGIDKGKIILKYDNVEIKQKIKNGKFEFSGFINQTTKARLIYKRNRTKAFYLDSSQMQINLVDTRNIKATPLPSNEYIWNIESITGSLTNQLHEELKNYIDVNLSSRSFNYMFYNYLSDKISKYPKNYLFYDFLNRNSRRQKYFTYKQYLDLAKKLDLSYLQKEEKIIFLRNIDMPRKLGIGMKFPSNEINNMDGEKENISDHLKKMTIINVWLINNKIDLRANERFIDLHEKYRSRGLNFIAVIADYKRLETYKALGGDELNYKNFYSKELISKLKLPSNILSQNYLLDEEGYIIGINLTTDEIEKVISSRI